MSQAKPDDVVYVVKTSITRSELQDVIDLLNKRELDDEDEKPLTIEEVTDNPELLSYLCECLVEQEHDISELWNDDGFCDFADYRK